MNTTDPSSNAVLPARTFAARAPTAAAQQNSTARVSLARVQRRPPKRRSLRGDPVDLAFHAPDGQVARLAQGMGSTIGTQARRGKHGVIRAVRADMQVASLSPTKEILLDEQTSVYTVPTRILHSKHDQHSRQGPAVDLAYARACQGNR